MKRLPILLLLNALFFCDLVFAETVTVRIYAGNSIRSLNLSPVKGSYELSSPSFRTRLLQSGDKAGLKWDGKRVRVVVNGKVVGTAFKVYFFPADAEARFRVDPVRPELAARQYAGALRVSLSGGSVLLVNELDLEEYVAGAVQAEVGGCSDNPEFFKVHAILSRSYALANLSKHKNQGYNLCDGENCQVYRGWCNIPVIRRADSATKGMVLADSAGRLISPAFHSNSGGQTVNSEDVWSLPASYLVSVPDTFSLNMPNAAWEKKMTTKAWLDYLARKFKYPVHDTARRREVLNFTQDDRKVYLSGKIPLRTIRDDLNLRSTFFSVQREGDSVVLKGKGYGHGVGLSQEGAIRMAALGYSCPDIIRFYYKGVQIIQAGQPGNGSH